MSSTRALRSCPSAVGACAVLLTAGAAGAGAADRIVYTCLQDICLIDPDSGGPTNMTQSAGVLDEYPVWSPDGSRIAFNGLYPLAPTGEESWDVFTFDAAAAAPVSGIAVTQTPGWWERNSYPTWSPDGTRVAFSAPRSRSR